MQLGLLNFNILGQGSTFRSFCANSYLADNHLDAKNPAKAAFVLSLSNDRYLAQKFVTEVSPNKWEKQRQHIFQLWRAVHEKMGTENSQFVEIRGSLLNHFMLSWHWTSFSRPSRDGSQQETLQHTEEHFKKENEKGLSRIYKTILLWNDDDLFL